jgi:uncharacterized protein YndB with AHSA1/START domain
MSDVTMQPREDGAAIRLERVLADPPAVVWRALTEPDELSRWFPCGIVVDGGEWCVGATLTFPFPAHAIDLTLSGEVLEVDAPHTLAYTWGDETLRFELHDHEGGTRLVVIDELEGPHAARNAAGWEDCLDRLQGIEPASAAWSERFGRHASAFEPALGPQEGPPEGYKGG